MIQVDGARGEGGGQILRSSLALSLVTGQPFRITDVRARREKPGLRQQHLTGVLAAALVGEAEVEGAHVGSREVTFRPRAVRGGEHDIDVGTAGSALLVLQAVLPALLRAGAPARLVVTGGTHAKHAPPYEYFATTYLPALARMGARVRPAMERVGFYPGGGGRVVLEVEPAPLHGLELTRRSPVRHVLARAVVARLPESIGARELEVVARELGWPAGSLRVETVDSWSPGNVLLLEAACDEVTEIATGFGQRGVTAERVAEGACEEMRRWLESGVPVGEHLADQIVLPLALAGGGAYLTGPLSLHATTNFDVIRQFLDVPIRARERADGTVMVEVGNGV